MDVHSPGSAQALVFTKSGSYVSSLPGAPGTSAALGNGNLRVTPWVVVDTIRITRVYGEITAAGDAGSTFIVAIFNDLGAGNRYPGSLAFDSSASGSASTILNNGKIAGDPTGPQITAGQEITVDWTIAPGVYHIGGVVQGAPSVQPTVRTMAPTGVATSLGTTLPAAGAQGSGFLMGGVTGALPATFSAAATPAALFPRIIVKT